MGKRRGRADSHRVVRSRTGDRVWFGQRFRIARRGLELTQETVAARSRITPKFVSEIENGHSNPSVAVAIGMITAGLGISLSEFFTDSTGPDEVAKIRALLAGEAPSVRRKAVRLIRVLVDD